MSKTTKTRTKTRSATTSKAKPAITAHREARKALALALAGIGRILTPNRSGQAPRSDREQAGQILSNMAGDCGVAKPYVTLKAMRALKVGFSDEEFIDAIGQAHRDYLRAVAIAGVDIDQDRPFRVNLAHKLDEARALLSQHALAEIAKREAWAAANPKDDADEPAAPTPANCAAINGYTIVIEDRITNADGNACDYELDKDDRVIRIASKSGHTVGQIIEAAARAIGQHPDDDTID